MGLDVRLDCGCCDSPLYQGHITHNLGAMADDAGIYPAVWRPEEVGIERAAQMVDHLRDGIALLKRHPKRFQKFNPSNGWGSYDGLIAFLERYLTACERYPEARVNASR